MTVLEKMINLATFDIIPTDALDDAIYYWPEADPFTVNFEMAGVESTLLLANIGFAIYLVYIHILAMTIHLCIHKLTRAATCIDSLHAKLSSYLYWVGLNRFYMELFFDVTFLSILNLHTVDWTTQFTSVMASNVVALMSLSLVCGVLTLYIFGYFR